ncbi:DUF2911 domain-containing protein [Gramella sp. MAR_2010_147]|uniref:DUF2911 domain-containing protein n=1 Tax=Gramella sp. MAR_2010_147 TaxID=1250205 RepID=UPI00087B98D5|nr:DUF2911 domain-containing protein [Gramella sp. MAR_2010_147]SDS03259.1 Protein of unknown function [Gramella sp. MAR_2010_147]
MNKSLKAGLKIGGIIALLGLILILILRYTTKAHSPEDTANYQKEDLKLEVFYNRPYKKEREIFGNLVPYNEVWRTGANEATTFETNQDIMVDGSLLEAGKYTLWTIPMENSWKIIFNSKMYPWGINLDKQAYRDPEFDSLVLERPVDETDMSLEQFTILFEQNGEFVNLVLSWDTTSVFLPIKKEEAPKGTSFTQ